MTMTMKALAITPMSYYIFQGGSRVIQAPLGRASADTKKRGGIHVTNILEKFWFRKCCNLYAYLA